MIKVNEGRTYYGAECPICGKWMQWTWRIEERTEAERTKYASIVETDHPCADMIKWVMGMPVGIDIMKLPKDRTLIILPRVIWYKPKSWKYLFKKHRNKFLSGIRGKAETTTRSNKIIISDP